MSTLEYGSVLGVNICVVKKSTLGPLPITRVYLLHLTQKAYDSTQHSNSTQVMDLSTKFAMQEITSALPRVLGLSLAKSQIVMICEYVKF